MRRQYNGMVSEFVVTNNAISVGINYTVSFIVQRNGFNSKSSIQRGKKEANQFEQIHEIFRDDLLLKPFLCTIKETV